MAIADVPTHRAGLFPEARIETTSLPAVGWGLRGRGLPGRGGRGCCRRRIRFANIGGNVASGFIQHPFRLFQAPLATTIHPPPVSRLISACITAGLMKNGNSYPSVLPSTLFYILTLAKNTCFATKMRYNV